MRLHILALLMIAAIGLGRAPVAGQSLADVAKKEEERRKTAKPADKTVHEQGPRHAATRHAVSAPAKPAASTDATAKETGKPAEQEKEKEPVKDQAYWAGRMKELHTQLDRDQTYADALADAHQRALDRLRQPRRSGAARRDRRRPPEGARRARPPEEARSTATKKAIADLEEEARRAGVPPGWLR